MQGRQLLEVQAPGIALVRRQMLSQLFCTNYQS